MERVTVLGTGLIGGSIGLGLRALATAPEVIGYDLDPTAAARALERGAVDRICGDPREAIVATDLVVLAVPLGQFQPLLDLLASDAQATTAVTDVASAKAAVVAAGEEALGARFVGGHPMAGSEREGIEASDPELFRDASWILTPTEVTSSDAYATAAQVATSLGARVVSVDPGEHDRLVARLSHVPQLVASALVDMAAGGRGEETLLRLAGGGFRDVTRIAASDPSLWVSILRTNRSAVLAALDKMGRSLGHARSLIESERWDELGSWLATSRTARLELFAKPVFGGEPTALSLIVPDRPGVLAEVTREAGRLGANIEDLRIVHSTEGGRGRLELVIAGAEAAERLAQALEELGYHVHRPDIDFSI